VPLYFIFSLQVNTGFWGSGRSMKPEQIYQELKDLAEKLGVTVSEQSFRASGIPVKSGFCLIKGEMHCIIDKNITLYKKTVILAESLFDLPHETMFVVPAVRDLIQKHGRKKSRGHETLPSDL
jgi:hypothetical protein